LHTENVIIAHEFQPVTDEGGDYLDYFQLSDGTIGMYVGDVPGKGPARNFMRRWPWGRCALFRKQVWRRAGFSPF
jgi:hypothetical protein